MEGFEASNLIFKSIYPKSTLQRSTIPKQFRPTFGTVGLFAYMNLDTWESLTEEEQQVIMEAAIAVEQESIEKFDTLALEEEAELLE